MQNLLLCLQNYTLNFTIANWTITLFPDLTDCELKPYVSYRTKEIYQEPLTAKDLFNAIYGHKMLRDFKEEKLDENGCSVEPSEEEKLTPDEAW